VAVLLAAGAAEDAYALDPGRPFARHAHEQWSLSDGLPFPGGYELAQDSEGYLWIGSMTGLARFDGRRMVAFDTGNTPAMHSNLVRGLRTEPRTGNAWCASPKKRCTRPSARGATSGWSNPSCRLDGHMR